MARLNMPDVPYAHITKYEALKGVDFSTDPTKISNSRLAYAQNVVVEGTGYIEKRLGHSASATLSGRVNGLHYARINGVDKYAAHVSNALYALSTGFTASDANPAVLIGAMADASSVSFDHNGKLYILDGTAYRVYDGSTLSLVTDAATVPTTTINSPPSGGGTSLDAVNLLTDRRRNTFLGDGTSTIFKLDVSGLNARTLSAVVGGAAKAEGTDFTVDRVNGKVTFTTAPANAQGLPNVEITFGKDVLDNPINRCRFFGIMQYGTGVYFFLSGDPNHPNMDWHSGINDPTYFPDTGYAIYGTSGKCMGYTKKADSLVMAMDESEGSGIYLRSAGTYGSDVVFPVTVGVDGVGTVSGNTIQSLSGEILMLTKRGIFALTSQNVASETVMRQRSYYLNGKLLSEDGLESALAAVWRGYYILTINGNAYVLDGNKSKSYVANNYGEYSYECTYWTNFPATCIRTVLGELYFGTADGRIETMNTADTTMGRYNDDGAAVVAVASTKADDDGYPMYYKNLRKKGVGLTLKPYKRSGCKVYFSTTKFLDKFVKEASMDILDLEDVDFDRWTFTTLDVPQAVPFLKKEKKYITLQITVVNDQPGEGFGLLHIVKEYELKNQIKRV